MVKARAAEAASKEALRIYCDERGGRLAFFEGKTGAPRTGIIDAVAFRLGRANPGVLDIRLIQLKGGKAPEIAFGEGVTAMRRLADCLEEASSPRPWMPRLPQFSRGRARCRRRRPAADDYSGPEAESWAEDEMLHEALTNWDKADGPEYARRRGRYDWWSRPPLRDLFSERDLATTELFWTRVMLDTRFKVEPPARGIRSSPNSSTVAGWFKPGMRPFLRQPRIWTVTVRRVFLDGLL